VLLEADAGQVAQQDGLIGTIESGMLEEAGGSPISA